MSQIRTVFPKSRCIGLVQNKLVFPVNTYDQRIAPADADPEACPLADLCDQVGVDTVAGSVTDPAEAGD